MEKQTVGLSIANAESIQISVMPEAQEQKRALIAKAFGVAQVASEVEAETAGQVLKEINRLLRTLEKSRKEVKGPVTALGKTIDATAREFAEGIEGEKRRLTRLVSDYASEKERERRQREEAARKAREDAERIARQKADAIEQERRSRLAREKLESQPSQQNPLTNPEGFGQELQRSVENEVAAKNAADARALERQATKAKASEGLANAGVSVREKIDFKIISIEDLARHYPDCVNITPRRSRIIQLLEEGRDLPGIEKIMSAKVITR